MILATKIALGAGAAIIGLIVAEKHGAKLGERLTNLRHGFGFVPNKVQSVRPARSNKSARDVIQAAAGEVR